MSSKQNYQLVLASQSPRRRELLEQAGFLFTVQPSSFIEESLERDPIKRAMNFSLQKAKDVVRQLGTDINIERSDITQEEIFVLGADTIVSLDGEVFEKPIDRDDAMRMLTKLSGNTHQVIGAIAILQLQRDNNFVISKHFYSSTDVTFRALQKGEIETYLDADEYCDKSGSYAIQGLAAQFVLGINGSYTNVVGLDIAQLALELSALGRDAPTR